MTPRVARLLLSTAAAPLARTFTLLTFDVDGTLVSGYSSSTPMVDSGSTSSFMRNPNFGRLRDGFTGYCAGQGRPGGVAPSTPSASPPPGTPPAERCLSEAERNPGGSEADVPVRAAKVLRALADA